MGIRYVKQIHISARWDYDAEKSKVVNHINSIRETFAEEGYNTEMETGEGWINLICRKAVRDGQHC